MTKKIAIVTGASSGLGKEYVRQISEKETLDEIWIIARRADRLHELSSTIDTPVKAIPLDLTKGESFVTLKSILEEEKPNLRILINAAGMGKIGKVKDIPMDQVNNMIHLNCQALADMTTICLPYCSKGSRILEIASIAGFQPMPRFAVYGATKAFVQSYTKALHHELLGTGIHVTAVCPYWISDTEFIGIADKQSDGAYRKKPLASKKKSVVSSSLRDSKLNLWISTPGIVTTVDRFVAKFVPDCIVVPIMDLVSKL